jgi:hypothetical protein
MKYTKLTSILEETIEKVANDESQCKRAAVINKLASQQIAAWREKRSYYQSRDEMPPGGEMDK